MADPIVLMHGTSDRQLEDILTHGLREPYLTCCRDLAAYYAIQAAEEQGANPVILAVRVADRALLSVDVNSIEEPVHIGVQGERWRRLAAERHSTPDEVLWQHATEACKALNVSGWAQLPAAAGLWLTESILLAQTVPPQDIQLVH